MPDRGEPNLLGRRESARAALPHTSRFQQALLVAWQITGQLTVSFGGQLQVT